MANWDEDPVTMAVEAARDMGKAGEARAVVLASTTHPFAVRQNAGIVAEALTLGRHLRTMDVGGGLRAATTALLSALDSAAAGRVVYSGFGLKHYQGLVIVRHAGDFFSAYGGNDRLLVREGDEVAAGAPLGLLARESVYARGAALYFEIRVRGRAVNALRYLPAS